MNKIDRTFEAAKKMGLTFDESNTEKNRLSDRTYDTYCRIVKGYENYLKDTYGIKDITRAKPSMAYDYMEKRIANYHLGGDSAFSMRQFCHAIEAFRQASVKTGVYQHAPRIGDKREMLGKMNQEEVFRRPTESKCMKATNSDVAKVRAELGNARTSNRSTYMKIFDVQQATAGRVTAVMKLNAGDVAFNPDGTATVHFEKDKGGLSRDVTVRDPKAVESLKQLTAGKTPGSPLFQVKNNSNQQKNMRESVKRYENAVQKAANRSGVGTSNSKFSTHSIRKNGAQQRFDYYRSLSTSDLNREIQSRRDEADHLDRKYMRTESRLKREMSDKEKAVWLASVDLGHGRLDVMKYYIIIK